MYEKIVAIVWGMSLVIEAYLQYNLTNKNRIKYYIIPIISVLITIGVVLIICTMNKWEIVNYLPIVTMIVKVEIFAIIVFIIEYLFTKKKSNIVKER